MDTPLNPQGFLPRVDSLTADPSLPDPDTIKRTPVGRLAAEHPATTRVFARYDLDYCCGGGRMLKEACLRKGVDLDQVVEEVISEIRTDPDTGADWLEAPLSELTRHIVKTYHEPLVEELPRLDGMVHKVFRVHGEKDPQRLRELVEVFTSLRQELEDHMAREEKILFPLIEAGFGGESGRPIEVMEDDHERAGAALRRIRELTDDFTPPQGACTTWRALWHGLGELERTMHEHVHLENNILFPRSIAGSGVNREVQA